VAAAGAGEPNMKNLMKKTMKRITESWPRRRPCVNDQLRTLLTKFLLFGRGNVTYFEDCLDVRETYSASGICISAAGQ
jgi:hypothetical protein